MDPEIESAKQIRALPSFHGPSCTRCKNYIWSICIYIYAHAEVHTHGHVHRQTRIHATHVHDTRATRVRVCMYHYCITAVG